MMPINVVDGNGFRELLNFIEPGYRIPSRGTITSRVEARYGEKKDELKAQLRSADKVAITTDCWTALTTESYITVTCRYIDEDWHLKSAVLLTEAIPVRHTAENLAEKLNHAVQAWGLTGRVTACIHDNAKNIVAANSHAHADWHSVPCFAHTLQLAINDGFAIYLHRIIAAAGKLVRHFNHSTADQAATNETASSPADTVLQNKMELRLRDVGAALGRNCCAVGSHSDQTPRCQTFGAER